MHILVGIIAAVFVGTIIADDANKKNAQRYRDEADTLNAKVRKENRSNYERIANTEEVHPDVREAARRALDKEV